MFYRLTHIDDRSLPLSASDGDRSMALTGGGIVMQRPGLNPEHPPGYAMLQLIGTWRSKEGRFGHPTVLTGYEWDDDDVFDFVGPVNHRPPPLAATGTRRGRNLTIELKQSFGPLDPGTILKFIEAANEPMTVEWERVTGRRANQDPMPDSDADARWRAAWTEPA